MVLGYKIKIKQRKKLSEDGVDLYGRYCPEKKEIHLLDHEKWRETLFHEIVHCVLDITGAVEGLGDEKEEQIVVAVTSGVFPLIGE